MKSPGHQQHPEHKVLAKKLEQRITVEIGGDLIADSRHVLEVDEDGYPPRYYFPRSDVRMDKLARSETTSQCPFKGTAHYFGVRAGGRTLSDAVWTYEDPYEEHQDLKERVAFWDEKVPEIAIHRS
jgi:uncharacterized protein (DUF427 family)